MMFRVCMAAVLATASAFRPLRSVTRPRALRMAIEEAQDGPLKKLTLTSKSGAEATLYTLGACVTSFKAPTEALFVRPDAKFDGSKPISGGLPHCFPQFGPGEMQQHGFARNLEWTVKEKTDGDSPSVTLELSESEDTLGMWDYKFQNLYTVTVGADNKLTTKLEVKNTGDEAFTFTGALHSYFQVKDISDTAIDGAFEGATHLNRMKDPPTRESGEKSTIIIEEETDSVYEGVSGKVKISDAAEGRTIVVDNKEGWKDTVIWSPFGDDGMGYKEFVCVESAVVKEPASVEAGASWVGEMVLSVN